VERLSPGLFEGTLPEFAERDRGISRKTLNSIAHLPVETGIGTSQNTEHECQPRKRYGRENLFLRK